MGACEARTARGWAFVCHTKRRWGHAHLRDPNILVPFCSRKDATTCACLDSPGCNSSNPLRQRRCLAALPVQPGRSVVYCWLSRLSSLLLMSPLAEICSTNFWLDGPHQSLVTMGFRWPHGPHCKNFPDQTGSSSFHREGGGVGTSGGGRRGGIWHLLFLVRGEQCLKIGYTLRSVVLEFRPTIPPLDGILCRPWEGSTIRPRQEGVAAWRPSRGY